MKTMIKITTEECKEIMNAIIDGPNKSDVKAIVELLNGPDDGCATAAGYDWSIDDVRKELCRKDIDRMDLSDMILLRRHGIAQS